LIEIDRAGGGGRDWRSVLLLLGALSPLAGGHQPPPFIVVFYVEPGRGSLGGNLVGSGIGHPLRRLRARARSGCTGQGEHSGERHREKRPSDGHDPENSKIPATRPARTDASA
jgi:hypothetical protein